MTTPDPVDAFDFSTVSPESVRAAADAAIAEADRHIDAVAADPERTFASTLARYDASTVAISGAGPAAFMAYVPPRSGGA